jgi:hypothetical protein
MLRPFSLRRQRDSHTSMLGKAFHGKKLAKKTLPLFNRFTMKLKTLFSIFAAGSFALSSVALAASSKTYQVTGPVLEMNDSMIAVQKGKDRWEVARDSSTKVTGDLKVGAKVTITYTMTATEVEAKADKAAKPAAKKP